jgi:hypothetical protein
VTNRPLFVKRVVALLGVAVVCHALAASSAQAGGWHHGQKYRAVNAYLVQGSAGVTAAPAASAAPAAYYTYSAAPAAAPASAPAVYYTISAAPAAAPAAPAASAPAGVTVYTISLPVASPAASAAPSPQAPAAPSAQASAPAAPSAQASAPAAPSSAAPNVVYVPVQAAPAAATSILTPVSPVTILIPHTCGFFCKH